MSAPENQVFVQGQGSVDADAYNTFVQWAGAVSGLRGFSGVPGMVAEISGYTAPNDGGQGFFYWNPTATAADDGGVTTVQVSGVAIGRWIRLAEAATAARYVAAFDFLGGTPPSGSECMGIHSFTVSVTFPANFAGSRGFIQADPTATFTALISSESTQVGTMVVSNSGVFSFTSTGGNPVTFSAGDAMIVIAPSSTDATAANFGWSMLGTLA